MAALAQPTFPLRRSAKARMHDDAINETPDLHRSFAGLVTVRDGDVQAKRERLLEFANEHGPLGIPCVRLTRPAADGTTIRQAGESLQDWLNEAATVAELVGLWDLVQRRDHA
ncbi:MAG: hypothetical protein ACYDAG_08385, partial [Chloroflexota bacterium]